MKRLVIVLSLVSINCGTFDSHISDQSKGLIHIDKYLSFVIAKSHQEIDKESKIQIILQLKNISGVEIYLSKPNCLGVYIMPFLYDSDGRLLPMLFRIKVNCKEEKYNLFPNATYEETFLYDLNKCFDFSNRGKYFLKFEYFGNVYDKNGQKLTHNEPLTSNTLEIDIH